MGELTPALEALLDSRMVGVLATQTPSGRPSQSVVYFTREGERLMISSVKGRQKVRQIERTGWASLNVMGSEQPFPSATFSGAAEILHEGIWPATAAIARRITGAEPAEEQTDETLASVGRLIIAIAIERVSAVSYLDD